MSRQQTEKCEKKIKQRKEIFSVYGFRYCREAINAHDMARAFGNLYGYAKFLLMVAVKLFYKNGSSPFYCPCDCRV